MNDTFLAQVKEEVQSTKVIKPKTLSQESLMDDAGDSGDEAGGGDGDGAYCPKCAYCDGTYCDEGDEHEVDI